MQRLEPSKTMVAVIDVQERLAAAMPADRMLEVTRKIDVLLASAQILGVHVIATEQYPKGLGHTISPLSLQLARSTSLPLEKTAFSAVEVPEFLRRLEAAAPAAVVVVGMEAHVCVYQTVRDLRSHGFEVHVPVDAVVSRHDPDRAMGIALCERTGAIATTVETVVFDWLERAGTDAFRAVSKLVR